MSKIIKSQDCVEAHPCRLDPVDVDAFFVNNREEIEERNLTTETDSETAAALEEILEALLPSDETEEDRAEIEETVAESPTEDENEVERKEPAAGEPEIDLFQINLEAERLIDQSKREAETLTRLAREKAESITGSAAEKAAGIVEQAKSEAERIKEEAESQAADILEKARRQAAEILNQAELEAENIINQAKQQAEELKGEARRQGSEAGYQEGLTKAMQEMEANLADSLKLLNQAEMERVRRITSSEAELLKLASGIAEKIIGSELQSHPEQFLSLVKEALGKVATANSITVKINPEDERLIQENFPVLQEVFSEPKTIGIKTDQTVPPGNCFVETEHGKVDARIKSQLEGIMKEILKVGQVDESG